MATQIKTDERLLARLNNAARSGVTRGQMHAQRVSFIYGALPQDSPITRNQIEKALHKIEE